MADFPDQKFENQTEEKTGLFQPSESQFDPKVDQGGEVAANAEIGPVLADPKSQSGADFGNVEPEYLAGIYRAEQTVQFWDGKIKLAQAELKELKETHEEAVIHLRSLIRGMVADSTPNLFSQPAEDHSEHDGKEVVDADFEVVNSETPVTFEDGEAWKKVPLADLLEIGAPKIVVDRLGEVGVNTLGEYSAWGEPNEQGYQKSISDLKGIGKAKVEAFDAALDKFWEEWKEIRGE